MSCPPLMPWVSAPSHKASQPLSYVRASSSPSVSLRVSEQKSLTLRVLLRQGVLEFSVAPRVKVWHCH